MTKNRLTGRLGRGLFAKKGIGTLLFALVLLSGGCGRGNEPGTGNAAAIDPGSRTAAEIEATVDETVYIAKDLMSMSSYDDLAAVWSTGNDFYFIAAPDGPTSAPQVSACYFWPYQASQPERLFELAPDQTVSNLCRDLAGNFYLLGYFNEPAGGNDDHTAAPDNGAIEYLIWQVDAGGHQTQILNCRELPDQAAPLMPLFLAVDDENNLVLATQQEVLVFDLTGKLQFRTYSGGNICDLIGWNGKVIIEYFKEQITPVEFREVNVSAQKLQAVFAGGLPCGPSKLAVGAAGELWLAAADGLYQYRPATDALSKKLAWTAHDYAEFSDTLSTEFLLSYGDNGVLVLSRDLALTDNAVTATAFREATPEEAAASQRTVITWGYPYSSNSFLMDDAVVEFNKTSKDYRLEVIYYDENIERLYAEMMTDNGPDLVALPPSEIDRLSAAGLLDDLYPYLDQDENLDRTDFHENLLRAFESDGHLYGLPLMISFDTIVAETAAVGERTGWTLDDLIDFTVAYPNGRGVFDDESKSAVLNILKTGYGEELLKRDAADPLDRELLTKMLNFANQYEDDTPYDPTLLTRLKADQAELLSYRIGDADVFYGLDSVFGEPVSFIGYPTASGNGTLARTSQSYGINARSEHKEAVWQFLARLISKEGLAQLHDRAWFYGFYTRRDTNDYHWQRFFEHAADYNGQGTFNFDFYSPAQLRFYAGKFMTGTLLHYPWEGSEGDYERMIAFIESVDRAYRPITAVDEIIEEEAGFYFDGTKPLDEVVDVIANRVRTYVNEMQ